MQISIIYREENSHKYLYHCPEIKGPAMKYIFLFLVCVVLIHCHPDTSRTEAIQSHAESYLKDHGYTGKEYEFVAITGLDTVTEKEFMERQLQVISLSLTNKESRLQRLDSIESALKKTLALQPNDQTILTNLNDITRSKTEIYVQQHKLDSLNATSKPEQEQKIKFIGMDFAFTSKDATGAPVLHHFYVKMDEQLNVLSATDLQQ